MLLIGAINLGLGLSSYHTPKEPDRIDLGSGFGGSASASDGTIPPRDLPVAVVRAFVTRYPHTVSLGAVRDAAHDYVIAFPPNAAHKHATFTADGAFVRED